VAIKSTKLRALLIFFVSSDETMDKDHEVDGTSLLFSESASYEADSSSNIPVTHHQYVTELLPLPLNALH